MRRGRACGRIALAMLLVAGATTAAAARPGQGGSIGSRGARTFTAPPPTRAAPFGAQAIGRTVTAPRIASAAPMPMRPGRALSTGFIAGLLAVGVGALLAGHAAHPVSWSAIALEVAVLVALLGFLILRILRTGGVPDAAPRLTRRDRASFERLLADVQRAWTLSDLATLGTLATPEMVGMLADQLRDLARRGARNATSQVKLLAADVAEAWREDGSDYATVAMRWRMIDITTDGTGRIIEGDPVRAREVTETWTFVRDDRGPWRVSAIQQS